MSRTKKIPDSLIFIFIGIIIGTGMVYSYYNFKNPQFQKSSEEETTDKVQSSACDIEDLDLSQEEKDLKSAAAYLKFKEIKNSFIPSGIPEIYGEELKISFDQVQDAINKVAPFDLTYGKRKIDLNNGELNRYIDIGSQIACEYCCGATTLVFENGEAACGCEHSQMMRGLSAYLIKNHPELSNEQILEELRKWKITYFPKQTLSKKLIELENSGESGIEEILNEFPDFLPQMVGGC